jgi:hypothetical protein
MFWNSWKEPNTWRERMDSIWEMKNENGKMMLIVDHDTMHNIKQLIVFELQ